MSRGIAALTCLVLLVGGCAGMSNSEQRVLSGGVIGAGGGLLLGGVPGAVLGAGAGAAGGYIYDKHEKSQGNP